jgi:hypothetical protein
MSDANELFVVTARKLADGSPVYVDASGSWTPRLQEAAPRPLADAEALAKDRTAHDQRNVADPYTFKVEVRPDGFIDALTARERIRSQGPTVPQRRPDATRPL